MTILFAFFGLIVFVPSTFTVGFKPAWKRMVSITMTGFLIDCAVIVIAVLVALALTY